MKGRVQKAESLNQKQVKVTTHREKLLSTAASAKLIDLTEQIKEQMAVDSQATLFGDSGFDF